MFSSCFKMAFNFVCKGFYFYPSMSEYNSRQIFFKIRLIGCSPPVLPSIDPGCFLIEPDVDLFLPLPEAGSFRKSRFPGSI